MNSCARISPISCRPSRPSWWLLLAAQRSRSIAVRDRIRRPRRIRRQHRLETTRRMQLHLGSHLCRPAQATRELGARLSESSEHTCSQRVAGCRVRDAAKHTDARPAAPTTCRSSAHADSSWSESTLSVARHTIRGECSSVLLARPMRKFTRLQAAPSFYGALCTDRLRCAVRYFSVFRFYRLVFFKFDTVSVWVHPFLE